MYTDTLHRRSLPLKVCNYLITSTREFIDPNPRDYLKMRSIGPVRPKAHSGLWQEHRVLVRVRCMRKRDSPYAYGQHSVVGGEGGVRAGARAGLRNGHHSRRAVRVVASVEQERGRRRHARRGLHARRGRGRRGRRERHRLAQARLAQRALA